MKYNDIHLSRRKVLKASSSVLAVSCAFGGALALLPGRDAFAQTTTAAQDPDGGAAQVSFAGPSMMLLSVAGAAVLQPSRVVVEDEPPSLYRLLGLAGRPDEGVHGGVRGSFSGRANAAAPRTFLPYATQIPAKAPGAAFDRPEAWSIRVDGAAVDVIAVHRRTEPVATAHSGPETYVAGSRHHLALTLSAAVTPGAEVAIRGPGSVSATVRRSDAAPSPAVHVCDLGYPLRGPKKGYAGLWLGHDAQGESRSTNAALSPATSWTLRDVETGAAAAAGTLTLVKPEAEAHFEKLGNFNGCDLYEADFSHVDAAGTYRLEVAGLGASRPFPITANPYAAVIRDSLRYLYIQRSGIALEEPYAEGWTRPRNGHPADGLTVYRTDVLQGRTADGFAGRAGEEPHDLLPPGGVDPARALTKNPNAWGSWHDAGDWDRRIRHMDMVFILADIVERLPATRALRLNLPESGKPFAHPDVRAKKGAEDTGDGATVLPDLIHEALWGLSLWRRTQGADGAIIGGVEYDRYPHHGSVSWNPKEDAFAYAEEEYAAYRFAEAAAKLGHVVRTVCGDAVLGAALIAEADAAWLWAESVLGTGVDAHNVASDPAVGGARLRAAACLYRANGRAACRTVFEDHNAFAPQGEDHGFVKDQHWWASAEYVAAGAEGRAVDGAVVGGVKGWVRGYVGKLKPIGADYGLGMTGFYGLGGSTWMRFGPGSGWPARWGMMRVAVGAATLADIGDQAIQNLWFALGCNPMNKSLVTGHGADPWIDPLFVDAVGAPVPPGIQVFGCAAGDLQRWEIAALGEAPHPVDTAWPRYARIYDASRIVRCAEHGVTGNIAEWLYAVALAHQVTTQ